MCTKWDKDSVMQIQQYVYILFRQRHNNVHAIISILAAFDPFRQWLNFEMSSIVRIIHGWHVKTWRHSCCRWYRWVRTIFVRLCTSSQSIRCIFNTNRIRLGTRLVWWHFLIKFITRTWTKFFNFFLNPLLLCYTLPRHTQPMMASTWMGDHQERWFAHRYKERYKMPESTVIITNIICPQHLSVQRASL